MELEAAKITTAFILLVMTLLFSFIPYLILQKGNISAEAVYRREKIISYLNCFGGGVFLGTLLTHIFTEGNEQWEDYVESVKLDTEFPVFYLFVGIGFFLVAFVELAAQKYLLNGQSHGNSHGMGVVEDAGQQPKEQTGDYGAMGENGGSNAESDAEKQNAELMGMRAFLLLVALSFHTIFDGLAVGLQDSEAEVWSVFGAITIHKSVISFCIGLEIFQTHKEKLCRAVLWLIIFALMSPIGIGIGAGLTDGSVQANARMLSSAILQGLSGGTFLYVTFLEILSHQIGHHAKGSILRLIVVLVGFCVMAASKLLDKD